MAVPAPALAQSQTPGWSCDLALPDGGDRDTGLAEDYLGAREGRASLLAPVLTLRLIGSDNVLLEPEEDEQSDLIGAVIPGFSACTAGPRFRAQLDYRLEYYDYLDEVREDDAFHRADATLSTELVPRRLFADLSGSFDQEPIDPTRVFNQDNAVGDPGNRSDVARTGVSPYWRQPLGSLGEATLRYAYRRTDFENEARADNESVAYSLRWQNLLATTGWFWDALYREQWIDVDFRPCRQYLDQAYVEVGRGVTGRLNLFVRGGLEDEYELATTDRFGAAFWDAGFSWSGPRTFVEMRAGEREPGTSYELTLRRDGPRLTTAVRYYESPEFISEVRFDIEGLEAPAAGETEPDVQEVRVDAFREDQVYWVQRLSARASYETARSAIRFAALVDDRDFLTTLDEDERVYAADASWRWRWMSRTFLIPRVRWEQREFGDLQEDTERLYQLSLARRLGRTWQAGLTVRHQEQDSTRAGQEYDENAVILELTKVF